MVRRKRNRWSNDRRIHLLMATCMMAGMMIGMVLFFAADSETVAEKAVAFGHWENIEPVISSRIGADYDEVGQCTGYVYWCLDNAYGVDWGSNSYVDVLENKLRNACISKVAEGRTGENMKDMQPGDIVIFLDGRKGTHCAILGENGRLYHAINSGVDKSMTLSEWMELPYKQRNCDRYVVYRGIL